MVTMKLLLVPRPLPMLGAALLLAAAGCGYSSDRMRCTDDCQREHDQCILHSTSAQQIQGCDEGTNQCMAVCAQY